MPEYNNSRDRYQRYKSKAQRFIDKKYNQKAGYNPLQIMHERRLADEKRKQEELKKFKNIETKLKE